MKGRTAIGVVATIAVIGLVIAGLFAAGSPGTARKFRIDRDRKDRLGQLHYVLAAHTRERGSLPDSLDDLSPQDPGAEFSLEFDPRKDPESGEFFDYRELSDREYEVCANFLTSSTDRRDEGYYGPGGDLAHKVGRNCYERRFTAEELTRDFYPRPVGPDPVIIPPRPESGRPTPTPTATAQASPSPTATQPSASGSGMHASH